jgi:hypothetical protein
MLPDLGHLQPAAPGDTDVWPEMRRIIEDAINASPRSLQKRIGPSEVGTPCDRCLAHKLAGTPEKEAHAPWLPFIGTAVHASLEDIFTEVNRDQPVRWLTEMKVSVGEIGGQDITGHADLFDLATGSVIDFKITGATTLKKARGGPSTTYRTQAHLYGRGFARRGLTVNRVRIAYLPRNSVHLGDAVIWSEPYDEQVALRALERANGIAVAIAALGAPAAIAATGPHTQDEFSCSKYPDGSQPSASNNTTSHLLNIA